MSNENPENNTRSLLINAIGQDTVTDLEQKYPAAFLALLKRDENQIKQILQLQSKVAEILQKLAQSQGIFNETDPEIIMNALATSTLHRTKEELDNRKGGKVMISVAGPGGAGKDTVLNGLKTLGVSIEKAVCTTTRAQRTDDIPGQSYHFKTEQEIIELVQNVEVSDDLASQLEKLGITNTKGKRLDSDLLTQIQLASGQIGCTIFLEAKNTEEDYPLYLTYNPGRGWYTVLQSEIDRACNFNLSVLIEDSEIVTKIIRSQQSKNPNLLGKVICVLPPHPVILHMALRAINRDEVLANRELPFDQLMSTIGERQIALMNEFSQIPAEMFMLVVNDKLQDGLPVASHQLRETFSSLLNQE